MHTHAQNKHIHAHAQESAHRHTHTVAHTVTHTHTHIYTEHSSQIGTVPISRIAQESTPTMSSPIVSPGVPFYQPFLNVNTLNSEFIPDSSFSAVPLGEQK